MFSKVQDYLQDSAMDAILRRKVRCQANLKLRHIASMGTPQPRRPTSRVFLVVRAVQIIYNVAWEDPRIDGKVLKMGPGETILMLTTGGCNVLDRLLDGVEHIVSVDLNPAQNALLELKLAAAQALTHEQFFQLFAHSNRRLFDAVYARSLRPLLSTSAAEFWDSNAGYFDDAMYSGASGGLARVLCWLVWMFGLQPLVRAFLTCRTAEEQCDLLDQPQYARPFNRMVSAFDFLLPVFCPFAGVPASQLRLVTGEAGDAPAGMTSLVRTFMDRVFRKTHLAGDNYFYYGYLYGKYSRTCCPRYLRPEYFDALKAAATRVTVRTALLHEAALDYADGYFSAMILLDHMDWLSPDQIAQEWSVFCRKLNPETGRVLWRSFSFEQRWPMLKFLTFDRRSVDETEAAMPDRVGMYNSCHLARVPPNLSICEALPFEPTATAAAGGGAGSSADTDRRSLIYALAQLVMLLPLVGPWLAALLSAFLRLAVGAPPPQQGAATSSASSAVQAGASAIGSRRTAASGSAASALLAVEAEGTSSLMEMLPGISGGSWVDVGGGLAEAFTRGGQKLNMYAERHVVHFEPRAEGMEGEAAGEAAAAGAAAAAAKEDVAGRVVHHMASVTADGAHMALCDVPAGSADVVTLCHALVAEDEWDERLQLASSLLKPGGILAVCDLAPPEAPQPEAGLWRKATRAVRCSLMASARPRSAAPHRADVVAKLAELTAPIHTEERAASWPFLSGKLQAAHFFYVGRGVGAYD